MFFSVIIPLYNKAPYVAKAIQSVISQTFADYELIIVDDGSTDNSADIALQAIARHQNCQLIKQDNAGVSMARNNGVAASQGRYLCFLDADDWWEPTFLEEMTRLIEEYPEAGIYGTSYIIVNETRHKTRIAPIGVEPGFEKGYINYCQVYAKTLAMPLTSITVAIPRAVFDEMHGFPKDIKLGEDFMLWAHIALKHQVAFLNKPLAYYNQDVDVANRGTNHLTPPDYNFFWQTEVFGDAEQTNADFKLLIDRLRGYGLQPYYLSNSYHLTAKREIEKIDKKNLTTPLRQFYSRPLVLARIVALLRKMASTAVYRFYGWRFKKKLVQ